MGVKASIDPQAQPGAKQKIHKHMSIVIMKPDWGGKPEDTVHPARQVDIYPARQVGQPP